MASNDRYATAVDNNSYSGSGTVNTTKVSIVRVDVSVDAQYLDTSDVESVVVYVNGRPLSRMHPSRAARLGIIRPS
jgi:hypothetical protein